MLTSFLVLFALRNLAVVTSYSFVSKATHHTTNNHKLTLQRHYGGVSLLLMDTSLSEAASQVEIGPPSSSSSSSVVAFASKGLSRSEGLSFIDDTLMPKREYLERIGLGRDAQGIGGAGSLEGPLSPSDPRLCKTYAEFPLSSMDQLTDLALQYLNMNLSPKDINDDNDQQMDNDKFTFIDIGSGCGRLVFYSALTRPSSWDIHGIEIAPLLHEQATLFLQKGVEDGVFFFDDKDENKDSNNIDKSRRATTKSLNLHVGAAEDHSNVLNRANLIFIYSTTFPAPDFSPELGAMVLDSTWSGLLHRYCENGCVVITTDRILDPVYGWELLDRLEVENPDVFGSIGYIQILRK